MSLFGSIGGAAKGFLTGNPLVSGFFDKGPEGYKTPEESLQLQDMRHHLGEQSRATEDDLIARQLAGTDPNAFSSSVGDQERFSTGLGGFDPAMAEAISNKSKKNFDTGFNRLKRGTELEAGNYRFNRMQAGVAPMLAKNQADREAAMRAAEAQSAQYAARANAIKGIFSTAGTIGGGLLGASMGGPMGAQIGSQIGSQAGGSQVTGAKYGG